MGYNRFKKNMLNGKEHIKIYKNNNFKDINNTRAIKTKLIKPLKYNQLNKSEKEKKNYNFIF